MECPQVESAGTSKVTQQRGSAPRRPSMLSNGVAVLVGIVAAALGLIAYDLIGELRDGSDLYVSWGFVPFSLLVLCVSAAIPGVIAVPLASVTQRIRGAGSVMPALLCAAVTGLGSWFLLREALGGGMDLATRTATALVMGLGVALALWINTIRVRRHRV